MKRIAIALVLVVSAASPGPAGTGHLRPPRDLAYDALLALFRDPPQSLYGPVPIWWWEGGRVTPERITWELETLRRGGVASMSIMNLYPDRSNPPYFSEPWWACLAHAVKEARRLGTTLWPYDQIGWASARWFQRAAKATPPVAGPIHITERTVQGVEVARLTIPPGRHPISAWVLPVKDGGIDWTGRKDVRANLAPGVGAIQALEVSGHWEGGTPPSVRGGSVGFSLKAGAAEAGGTDLTFSARGGRWRLFLATSEPGRSFYMNPRATEWLIAHLFEPYARRFPDELGKTILGFFQDELPSIPPNLYTKAFAEFFEERKGYDLAEALPALWLDVGPATRRYRCDYFDAYLAYLEETCFAPIYRWLEGHDLAMSHDQHGRLSIRAQTRTYVDYFRTQRWYAAPGNDDWANNPIGRRNYFDMKCSSSIAHLYGRPRVWLEGFHSSGWGRRPEETMAWLAENFAYGATIYDEHGLYFGTKGGWWELAPPDPHFRQPYWRYYGGLTRWVARLAAVLSAGRHACDAAVLYPSTSLHAEWSLRSGLAKIADRIGGEAAAISRDLYLAAIDSDFIDDASVERALVRDGALHVGGEAYRALVLGPLTAIRRRVAEKALALARSGGIVVASGRLPRASAEKGDGDPELAHILEALFGPIEGAGTRGKREGAGAGPAARVRAVGAGHAAFVPRDRSRVVAILDRLVGRPFHASDPKVYGLHRRLGAIDLFWLVNVKGEENAFASTFRAAGRPEIWDPWTGEVRPVLNYRTTERGIRIPLRIPPYHGRLIVFVPGREEVHAVEAEGIEVEAVRVAAGRDPRPPDRLARVVVEGVAPRGGHVRAVTSPIGGERLAGGADVPPPPASIEIRGPWSFTAETVLDNLWGDFRWPPWKAREAEKEKAGAEAPEDASLPRFRWIGPEARRFRYREESPGDRGPSAPSPGFEDPGLDDAGWDVFTYSVGPYWKRLGPWAPGKEPKGTIDAAIRPGGIEGPALRVGARAHPWARVTYSELFGTEEKANVFFGPKGYAPEDFLALPDAPPGSTYLLATHLVAREPVHLRLRVRLAADAEAWLDGTRVGPDLALDLRAGWNPLVLRLRKRGKGPLRGWIVPGAPAAGADALLREARWIWAPGEGVLEAWFRKTFELAARPRRGEIVITADNDYALYVNGRLVGRDAGFDTSVWKRPERYVVTDLLVPGRNAIAVRCLDRGPPAGLLACASIDLEEGGSVAIATDASWRVATGMPRVPAERDLDDRAWARAREIGPYGTAPWGELEPAGGGTRGGRGSRPEPSPYLRWFQDPRHVVLDVKGRDDPRVGWFRFRCPPGTKALRLEARGRVRAWVDGRRARAVDGRVELPEPARRGALVALRVEQDPGRYGGAAFLAPVAFVCGEGEIELGDWSEVGGLRCFSGIGVYRKRIDLPALDGLRATLDLGEVRVAAEVRVNGERAGISLRRPYRFDITPFARPGANVIEVRVANTVANHYRIGTRSPYVYPGQTVSGLLGPVRIELERRVAIECAAAR